jgi:aminoglycoside phosphotransferase (APT) family kinase protein
MTTEAAAIAAAARAGVPVPAVVCASDAREPFGAAFLVMEHVEGEARPARVLRDPALAAARRSFAADCGHALGAVARSEPVPALELPDQVAHYRSVLDDLGAAVPTFEWAFRVLERDRPPAPDRPTVVHGDFRLGNLLVDEHGLRAVLDWELVHLGDPVEDLGWLCAKAWRFGARPPVGGIGQRAELLDAYEEVSGTRVDERALAWWEAFSALKWGVICLVQASRHLVGGERSVELAAIGRRVAEVELDLLEVLP